LTLTWCDKNNIRGVELIKSYGVLSTTIGPIALDAIVLIVEIVDFQKKNH